MPQQKKTNQDEIIEGATIVGTDQGLLFEEPQFSLIKANFGSCLARGEVGRVGDKVVVDWPASSEETFSAYDRDVQDFFRKLRGKISHTLSVIETLNQASEYQGSFQVPSGKYNEIASYIQREPIDAAPRYVEIDVYDVKLIKQILRKTIATIEEVLSSNEIEPASRVIRHEGELKLTGWGILWPNPEKEGMEVPPLRLSYVVEGDGPHALVVLSWNNSLKYNTGFQVQSFNKGTGEWTDVEELPMGCSSVSFSFSGDKHEAEYRVMTFGSIGETITSDPMSVSETRPVVPISKPISPIKRQEIIKQEEKEEEVVEKEGLQDRGVYVPPVTKEKFPPPQNVKVQKNEKGKGVVVSWSFDKESFDYSRSGWETQIERKAGKGGWIDLGPIPPANKSRTFEQIKPSQSAQYRIRFMNREKPKDEYTEWEITDYAGSKKRALTAAAVLIPLLIIVLLIAFWPSEEDEKPQGSTPVAAGSPSDTVERPGNLDAESEGSKGEEVGIVDSENGLIQGDDQGQADENLEREKGNDRGTEPDLAKETEPGQDDNREDPPGTDEAGIPEEVDTLTDPSTEGADDPESPQKDQDDPEEITITEKGEYEIKIKGDAKDLEETSGELEGGISGKSDRGLEVKGEAEAEQGSLDGKTEESPEVNKPNGLPGEGGDALPVAKKEDNNSGIIIQSEKEPLYEMDPTSMYTRLIYSDEGQPFILENRLPGSTKPYLGLSLLLDAQAIVTSKNKDLLAQVISGDFRKSEFEECGLKYHDFSFTPKPLSKTDFSTPLWVDFILDFNRYDGEERRISLSEIFDAGDIDIHRKRGEIEIKGAKCIAWLCLASDELTGESLRKSYMFSHRQADNRHTGHYADDIGKKEYSFVINGPIHGEMKVQDKDTGEIVLKSRTIRLER